MKKVGIVYWSGTGNTEAMANFIAEGAKAKGAEVKLIQASSFDERLISEYDSFAFGCPSMGSEVLEESEFDPMFESIEKNLGNKPVALFGSYGWGDGEWMRNWEDRCKSNNMNLASDFVICNEFPNDEAIEECKDLGSSLA